VSEANHFEYAMSLAAFDAILREGPGMVAIHRAADLTAHGIVSSPEMQAIKTALIGRFVPLNPAGRRDANTDAVGRSLMASDGLPESVIVWVLS
jgi:hypothetical protein